jgi:hypothetical protein
MLPAVDIEAAVGANYGISYKGRHQTLLTVSESDHPDQDAHAANTPEDGFISPNPEGAVVPRTICNGSEMSQRGTELFFSIGTLAQRKSPRFDRGLMYE